MKKERTKINEQFNKTDTRNEKNIRMENLLTFLRCGQQDDPFPMVPGISQTAKEPSHAPVDTSTRRSPL